MSFYIREKKLTNFQNKKSFNMKYIFYIAKRSITFENQLLHTFSKLKHHCISICALSKYISLFNPKMSNSFLVHILRNWKEKSPRVVLIYKGRKEVNRPKNFIFSKDCCVKCRTFILGFKFISVFIF